MLKLFRIASLAEGISLLVILSVTIGFISRDYVYVLGMTHGVLFLLYCAFSLVVSHRQKWSVVTWVLILLASLVPFAFIPVEIFLKREMQRAA
jgi:integral membrane protein